MNIANSPSHLTLPDHKQLPESDGTFVKNFQEHPQSLLLTSSIVPVENAKSIDSLLGLEGNLAAAYFGCLSYLINDRVDAKLHFDRRNRRPPKDRFNALLSFGYALLLKDVVNSILAVGLEPARGFYHQPRTQAPPLALDLMEIFRVPLVDAIVLGSINRLQWDVRLALMP